MNKIVKKILRIIVALIIAGAIIYFLSPSTMSNLIEPNIAKHKSLVNSDYITTTYWNKSNVAYKIAVEVDDFNGDIIEAGEYDVYLLNAKTTNDEIPIKANIYIDKDYENVNEIAKKTPVLKIGGPKNEKKTYKLTLKKGDYVYIVPINDARKAINGTIAITARNTIEK
ncbi:DhnA family fructose-bisphosphate aldolase class Ia [Bacilli bacterium PM5-3]|nr:DhnA family fructose-bisphosphate aldolase class Ia [Bacilli bacterium PM5-3]